MPEPSFLVEGLRISASDLDTCAQTITRHAGQRPAKSVFTINLDHVVKIKNDRAFREAYQRADLVVPDGFPIVLAGLLQKQSCTRVAGSDLIHPLCDQAVRERKSIFLYGSSNETLATAAQLLQKGHPGLRIVGQISPALDFTPTSAEARAHLATVEASGADICLVALGAPKQELFADLGKEICTSCTFVCIGAGLDFISGEQRRAPAWMQRTGMEWIWRLAGQPARLAHRYWLCLVVLPSVLRDAFAVRLGKV